MSNAVLGLVCLLFLVAVIGFALIEAYLMVRREEYQEDRAEAIAKAIAKGVREGLSEKDSE